MAESVNWQELGQQDFLGWVILHASAKYNARNPELFEEMSDATDRWTNCILTMQINGIEVDAVSMIRLIEEHMKTSIESAAREYCVDLLGDKFTELEDVLDNAKRSILDKFPVREDEW